jgi:hypothetical protein
VPENVPEALAGLADNGMMSIIMSMERPIRTDRFMVDPLSS